MSRQKNWLETLEYWFLLAGNVIDASLAKLFNNEEWLARAKEDRCIIKEEFEEL